MTGRFGARAVVAVPGFYFERRVRKVAEGKVKWFNEKKG